MLSMKVVLILMISTNMCSAFIIWNSDMKAFCAENRFNFVTRDSDSKLHFYRGCDHWVVGYDTSTNTFDLLSYEPGKSCSYRKDLCLEGNECIIGDHWEWKWNGHPVKDGQVFGGIREFIAVFWLKDEHDTYMIGEKYFERSDPKDQYVYRFKQSDYSLHLENDVYGFFFSTCKYGFDLIGGLILVIVLIVVVFGCITSCVIIGLYSYKYVNRGELEGFRRQPVYGSKA